MINPSSPQFLGMLEVQGYGRFFTVLISAITGLALLFTHHYSRARAMAGDELYGLVLFAALGMILVAGAVHWLAFFLGLEVLSLSLYVLIAIRKGDARSNEAGLKYFVMGAVSSAFLTFGIAVLYSLTGTLSIPRTLNIGIPVESTSLLFLGFTLILTGIGFKISMVPFHLWTPDVYQGAATPVTALLSVLPKAAGLAILLRFFYATFSTAIGAPWDLVGTIEWPKLLMLLSILTMTVGNVAALTQTNMKRLLAYSSIAHAGYLLMGIVALSETGARGLLVYLAAYLVMNLGAFLVVTLVHLHEDSFDLRDYPGLYRRSPFLTVAMAFFLLSLVGIPPFVGFLGKLYVFGAVIEQGYGWYALVGAVNAAIAAYYYFKVIKVMVLDTGNEDKPKLVLAFADRAWIAAFALANLLPLVFWSRIDAWVKGALVLYAGR